MKRRPRSIPFEANTRKGFLGIELKEKRNATNEGAISTDADRATVRVIRTDKELMIAKTGCRVLGLG